MQDKIILGLLSLRPMSLYEIRAASEQSIGLFYNSSIGSLHPALKKLSQEHKIDVEETIENGRAKKVYTITSLGKSDFQDWLCSEIVPGKVKDTAILKVFYLSETSRKNAIQVLTQYLESMAGKAQELQELSVQLNKKKVPEESKDRFYFQMKSLEFGINYYQFVYDWYQKFIEELKSK